MYYFKLALSFLTRHTYKHKYCMHIHTVCANVAEKERVRMVIPDLNNHFLILFFCKNQSF